MLMTKEASFDNRWQEFLFQDQAQRWIFFLTAALLLVGEILVTSASLEYAQKFKSTSNYFWLRHTVYLMLSIIIGCFAYRLPLSFWEKWGARALLLSFFLLFAVWIPGLGIKMNGSHRWIRLPGFTLQPSEFVKLFVVVYLAGYLVRKREEVLNTFIGFVKPFIVLLLIVFLLLCEPDFGAAVVIMGSAMSMIFLSGARISQFILLFGLLLIAGILLVVFEPYRMGRVFSFVSPWEDPYNKGYQLTQSLIAIGRGEWFGVGLGNSVQKLFYLPEAHTDFVYAVLAEELGLVGAVCVILAFVGLFWASFRIGIQAIRKEFFFAGYLAWGIGMLIGLQAMINIGVSLGVLPTKGITLPFVSYGGTSLVVSVTLSALLLRIGTEVSRKGSGALRKV